MIKLHANCIKIVFNKTPCSRYQFFLFRCVKNDKGCLVFTDTEKLKAWKEHYEKLLNKEFPWDSNLLQMENPKVGPAPWLEKDAIYTALK